jgi:thymidine phosphorylase
MRSLIQSLTPDDRQISWRRVGGMFALYVVLMVTAAGVFVSHESSRKLAHEPATTVAADAKTRSIAQFAAND